MSWTTHDYVADGLVTVDLAHAFPHRRALDHLHHPWPHLRRDVPHTWYADERHPSMGFLNVDEAMLLHNIALGFAGRRALEIGSWLGWSTAHLAAAGLELDVVDPAHDDPAIRASVEASLAAAGVADRVHLAGGRSPDGLPALAARRDDPWSLVFVDGDHEGTAPARDALACLPHVAPDCAFVFHDVAAPAVAAGLRALAGEGFEVLLYQTAQLMAVAWRGDVVPPAHRPDPTVAWQLPVHLLDLPVAGAAGAPGGSHSRTFASLRELPAATSLPSVCVVTNEVLGPFKNGGIGTSMTGLAESLATSGVPVTVLYTGNIWTPDRALDAWVARYAELGIELAALSFDDMREVSGPVRDHGFAVPFLVHRWLSARHFDVVHFNDCCADGSIAVAAKELGLAYPGTLLVTALHSPSQWVLELNETLPTSLLLAAYAFAEREAIRGTDVLWSPSRYLLRWVAGQGYRLPQQTFVQQYSLPSARLGDGPAPDLARRRGDTPPPTEIVFFGRLEERKGLRLFCNALQLLEGDLAARGTTVTFLGKPQTCGGMPALEYLDRRSAEWRFPIRILTELGQPEAVAYLREDHRLAVMASPADNSPCTVYEALTWGIPFLAARTGGIPELVHADDRDAVLFPCTSEGLRTVLAAALEGGGRVARPAVEQADTRADLLAFHERWERLLPEPVPPPVPSRWGLAIVDHRAGDDLGATLASIEQCTWIQHVVVLDRSGSVRDSAGAATVIDLTRQDPGELAELLLGATQEDVALVHSGISVLPQPFAEMLGALDRAGVDALLPVAEVTTVSGRTTYAPPLGGSAAFSLFEGVTFTGAMAVRRSVLAEVVAGRSLRVGSPFLGLADACVAAGRAVRPYPAATVRWPAGLHFDVRNPRPDRVGAYGDAGPIDRYYMLSAGVGASLGAPSASQRRDVALALVDLGLGPAVRVASFALRKARVARSRLAGGRLDRRLRAVRR